MVVEQEQTRLDSRFGSLLHIDFFLELSAAAIHNAQNVSGGLHALAARIEAVAKRFTAT